MRAIWLLLASCDRLYAIHAAVHDRTGQPVTARVSLVCDGQRRASRSTDAHGKVVLAGVGTPGRECVITVRRGGGVPISYPMMDYCTDERLFGGCVAAELHAIVP